MKMEGGATRGPFAGQSKEIYIPKSLLADTQDEPAPGQGAGGQDWRGTSRRSVPHLLVVCHSSNGKRTCHPPARAEGGQAGELT